MKILCLTNSPVSFDNANGKFIRNYLYSLKPDEICNFYVSGEKQDENIDSFCISNCDLINYTKKIGFYCKQEKNSYVFSEKEPKKTPFKHLVRYFLYKLGFWKKSGIYTWISNHKPTHILLAVNDNLALLDFALKIRKKMRLPLILIVGENYALKNYNYIEGKNNKGFLVSIFLRKLRKITSINLKHSMLTVFNSKLIEKSYMERFDFKNSIVLYPPADVINFKAANTYADDNLILYAGNLNVGRLDALIEFSSEIAKIFPAKQIHVYSKISDEVIKTLSLVPNITYKGFVKNDELNDLIKQYGLLLHVESNSEYFKRDLVCAFSTKIANNIKYGKRFFLYAPDNIAESLFFSEKFPNNVCHKKEEICEKIKKLFDSEPISSEYPDARTCSNYLINLIKNF